MFAIIIGLIVIALVVTLLLKGYYPQAILFILKTVESTLSQIRRRRARGTSGLWPSSP